MKTTMKTATAAMAAVVMMAGCAGRAPNPVSAHQPTDAGATCATLRAEITANEATIAELQDSKTNRAVRNVAVAVGGVFVPVLFLGLDVQQSQEAEIAALETRNAVLGSRLDTCAELVTVTPYHEGGPPELIRRLRAE